MNYTITERAKERRKFWIKKIKEFSNDFEAGINHIENELNKEITDSGSVALIEHLRLCGNIPEIFQHDSTEEKIYSKYTDFLLSFSFKYLGLNSFVLKERADSADVEVFAKDYSFIADAKSFRLSRTAKNQKDFKVQAMDTWKRGKKYAMIVCPVYQLPNRSSQIYLQATTRNVCIFSYSHLTLLLTFSEKESKIEALKLLEKILHSVSFLNPSKDAVDYWLAINRAILSYSPKIELLWQIEKDAASQSLEFAKEESLLFLAEEREKIMRMQHYEALQELLRVSKIESKATTIKSVADNGLLNLY